MFNLGPSELLVIFVVALLVFGPKKLPELGKSLGKGLNEFRRASAEMRNSLEREMQTIEQEVQTQETHTAAAPLPESTVAHAPEAHNQPTPAVAARDASLDVAVAARDASLDVAVAARDASLDVAAEIKHEPHG